MPPPPPPPAVRIAPSHPVTCPAEKHYFDMRTKTWKRQDSLVRITNPGRGFEAGGMRICFDVEEVDESGFGSDCVAKFFRKNIQNVVEADYFNEGAAQCLSEEFAENFNKQLNVISRDATPEMRASLPVLTMRISFLMCHVVKIKWQSLPDNVRARPNLFGPESFFTFRTQDTREVMFVMEPKLRGEFTKYNSNFGEIYESADARKQFTPEQQAQRHAVFKLAEAFSHFSLKETAGSMLVCDLQGVKDFFTDPQIHTEDGKGLGMGNMGQEGIDKWVQSHHCNEYCKVLKLDQRPQEQVVLPPSIYAELRNHAQPVASRVGPASILPAEPHSPNVVVEFVQDDDGHTPLQMQNDPPQPPAARPTPGFQPPPPLYGGPTSAPIVNPPPPPPQGGAPMPPQQHGNYYPMAHPVPPPPPASGYVPINTHPSQHQHQHQQLPPVTLQGIPLQQQGYAPMPYAVPPPGYPPAPAPVHTGYYPPAQPQQRQQQPQQYQQQYQPQQQVASPNGGMQKPVGQMTYEEQLALALRNSTLDS